MSNVKPTTRRELLVFLIVGCLAVLTDYLTYRSILWLSVTPIATAKAISFIAGTAFAYFANRFWTFGHSRHGVTSIWRFVLLYATTMMVNVGVNSAVLHLLGSLPFALHIAYLMATGSSATLNFLGMKFFVFTNKPLVFTS